MSLAKVKGNLSLFISLLSTIGNLTLFSVFDIRLAQYHL